MGDKKSFLWRIYAFAFLNHLIPIYSLYSITFQEKGLSVAQIGTALIFWSVFVILFQLPVGVLADRMSRRNMLIFGNVICSLAFFIFMVWPTFTGVMIGFALWGLTWAITAVCFQPMVYDHIKNKEKYLSVLGSCESIGLVGLALSSLCSFLVFLGYDFLTWCTIGFMGLGIVVLIGLPNDRRISRRNISDRITLRDVYGAAKFVFVRPELLAGMGVLAILDGVWNIDDWLGLIALELGYPESAVGLLSFFSLVCGVIGGFIVSTIRCVPRMLLPILIAGSGCMLAVAAILFNLWATIALCVFWLILVIGRNIVYADFQNKVSTYMRSRATAILEIMLNIGTILTYGILTASKTFGDEYGYGMYALGGILVVTSLMLVRKK